ncbi:xanthine dehydrogenase family protein molybdopterin-binding subunit [Ramlibacter tataouinensis]|uniref:Candidate Xanthine dehydrogenase yagR, molybdenum binding subunit n=1 Tax=Ramlibacter tataouinensis (strain ATCC BAA-407 / DSM 14655 / LMG 21543 / TTB310) TaxID=365046 RepID=F5XVH8_RAMTT|nr:xanthine dehydrogenase family protein molybdopterin-binding subunit [Ramlibacter tataouinensis]AEG91554.1 Candidate Xanthine dehydrogenase yagR, molybdenum binding subunit [Ramlibacter tataouinensis TTB310]
MSAPVPKPQANMGEPIARREARAKVTGAARYAADMPVANPAHAYLVTSTIGRGRVLGFNEAPARAVPGVLAVMTHANRPKLQEVKHFFAGGQGLTAVPPLAGPEVHHDGQIVAMVVAETYEAAREAAHRLGVRYERQAPAATFGSKGLVEQRTAEVLKERKDPALGDAEAGFRAAAAVVDAQYGTPTQHHNPIELFATTAHWLGDELTVYEPSQFVYGLRTGLAEQLGMPPEKIRVVNDFVGGAFGSKGALTQRTALVALAARQLGRPVKLVATRDQGFTISGHRHETRHRVRLGATREGRFTAYQHDIWELNGRTDPYVNGGIENSAAMYAFPAVASTGRMVRADRNPPIFMRSPPEVPVMYALESAIDELAVRLSMDPVELRRRNDTDRNWVTGKPYTSRSLMQCYDAASEAFGWRRRNPQPGSMREGDWLVGWGCATATYPTQMSPAVARVRLAADGTARVEIAAHDVGTGAYTVIGQMAAQCLSLSPERVAVTIGDSVLPPGPVSGGSVTTASACSAVKLACDQILARLGLAGGVDEPQRKAAFEKLQLGAIEETGNYVPASSRSKSTAGLYSGSVDISGGANMENGVKTMFAFGAEFVEVRVHARTREIRVPRIVGAFAAGRIMNPRTAHSQLMGGMIWGIGSALHEFTEIDTREARYINDNLAEYLVPVNADIRQVDVIFVPEVDQEANPVGAKGIGELANVGTAAAVANAVFHATGRRIRELPITVDKLIA